MKQNCHAWYGINTLRQDYKFYVRIDLKRNYEHTHPFCQFLELNLHIVCQFCWRCSCTAWKEHFYPLECVSGSSHSPPAAPGSSCGVWSYTAGLLLAGGVSGADLQQWIGGQSSSVKPQLCKWEKNSIYKYWGKLSLSTLDLIAIIQERMFLLILNQPWTLFILFLNDQCGN